MRLIIHFPGQPSFTIDMVEEPHKDSNNDPSFLEDSHLVTPSSNNLSTIFWYSSYDSRTGDPGNKGLWSEPEAFGERAHFRVSQAPAVLSIRNLTKEDGGVYTCRSGTRIDSFRELSLHFTIPRCFLQYTIQQRDFSKCGKLNRKETPDYFLQLVPIVLLFGHFSPTEEFIDGRFVRICKSSNILNAILKNIIATSDQEPDATGATYRESEMKPTKENYSVFALIWISLKEDLFLLNLSLNVIQDSSQLYCSRENFVKMKQNDISVKIRQSHDARVSFFHWKWYFEQDNCW